MADSQEGMPAQDAPICGSLLPTAGAAQARARALRHAAPFPPDDVEPWLAAVKSDGLLADAAAARWERPVV
jgi:hypothetical protein